MPKGAKGNFKRKKGAEKALQKIQKEQQQAPMLSLPVSKKRKREELQLPSQPSTSSSHRKKEKEDILDPEETEKILLSTETLLSEIDELDREEKHPLLKNLNRLAWLLNHNTKSCTAALLVNGKLLITDNDTNRSTRKNNFKFLYIERVLDNLRNMVGSFQNASALNKELLASLFELIFEQKFKGGEAGYLVSIKEYQTQIKEGFTHFILTGNYSEKTKRSVMKKMMMEAMLPILVKGGHSEQKIHTAIGLGISVVWRLQKIIPFLASEANGAPTLREALNMLISNALGSTDKGESEDLDEEKAPSPEEETLLEKQEDVKITVIRYILARVNPNFVPTKEIQDWLKSDSHGSAILATNGKGTHAELRAIDCLLASRIVRTESQIPTVHIGISRKCCRDCYIAISAINAVLSSHEQPSPIKVSGSHYRRFDSWEESRPFFLLKSNPERKTKTIAMEANRRIFEKTEKRAVAGSEGPELRDAELIKKILEKFEEIQKTAILPPPQDYMSQEDSSTQKSHSNISVEGLSPIPPAPSSVSLVDLPNVILDDSSGSHSSLFDAGTPAHFSPQHRKSSSSAVLSNRSSFENLGNNLTNLLESVKEWQNDVPVSQEDFNDVLEVIEQLKNTVVARCQVIPPSSINSPK